MPLSNTASLHEGLMRTTYGAAMVGASPRMSETGPGDARSRGAIARLGRLHMVNDKPRNRSRPARARDQRPLLVVGPLCA
jgi:hypothetical protein